MLSNGHYNCESRHVTHKFPICPRVIFKLSAITRGGLIAASSPERLMAFRGT